MKLKLFGSFLLIIAVFLSCKKEDSSKLTNSADLAGTLSKILIDNQSTIEYTYNNLNLLTEEKSKYDLSVNHYDGKGQLISTDFYGNDALLSNDAQVFQAAMNSKVWITTQNGIKGGSIIYEYNDKGLLTKSTCSRPLSTSSEYSDFSYDANNRISRQTMYWENTVTGYIDYSYDTKGNLIKEMLYNIPSAGVTELVTSSQYNFDNQSNPYKQISKLKIPGIDTNANNIIKETYTIHLAQGQGTDTGQVTETSYEYNSLGYPKSKNGNTTFVYN
jgi:hypothetical protein